MYIYTHPYTYTYMYMYMYIIRQFCIRTISAAPTQPMEVISIHLSIYLAMHTYKHIYIFIHACMTIFVYVTYVHALRLLVGAPTPPTAAPC